MHSSVDGHGVIPQFAIVNNAVVNIGMEVPLCMLALCKPQINEFIWILRQDLHIYSG